MEKSTLRALIKVIILSIVFMFSFQLTGCSNSVDTDDVDGDSITVNLKSGEVYQYYAVSGDEEGAVISLQASHYERREILRNAKTNYSVVYFYQSATDYTGSDSVELTIFKNADGVGEPSETIKLKINFVIRNM